MPRISLNRASKPYVIFLIFAAFGLLALILTKTSNNKAKDWVETTAVITDIEVSGSHDNRSYTAYVKYTFNSKEYEDIRLNEYESGMYINKEIKVKVNPTNPYECAYVDGGAFELIGLGLLSGGLFFAGLSVCLSALKKM